MTDLDSLVRDAVAREAAATVTPEYGVLAIRARHHRFRRTALGVVAVAAGVAVVALMAPFGSGGSDVVAATQPFERLAGDERAQANVRSCMVRGGVPWGDGPLPGLPGGARTLGERSLLDQYVGCLANEGYLPPPAEDLRYAGPCDGLLGRATGPGDAVASGQAGGRTWRVGTYISDDGMFCAWHTYGDSGVLGVAGGWLVPKSDADQPRFTPLAGSAYTLVYGTADRNVVRVAVEIMGKEVRRVSPVPFKNGPMRFVYALAVRAGVDPADVVVVQYDEAGNVVARYAGG